MKIVLKSYPDNVLEERDYRQAVEIHIDGECVFSVSDGEPEDANLSRDFGDVWGILDILQIVHNAGANGETLELYREDLED